ncbi:MAG: ribonuclease H-like domain-containing protein [Candidatus Altiarchaeota archaeon]|nr:ribonuclease H-like domain-containing protein [Candidatus Altiarchaeota archaeon]
MDVLLDATYKTVDEKAVIELFYKPSNNLEDKTIKEVKDFEPYFYALPKSGIEDLVEEINSSHFPQIKKVEIAERIDLNKTKKVALITVNHPRNVPEIRDKITDLKSCSEVREADIRFVQRYIIDASLVPMGGIDKIKPNIASFDIETAHLSSNDKSEDRILMISYADTKGLKKVWTFKHQSKLPFVESLPGEKEMIQKFIETVKNQRIDLIVSYNGDNFDFPVIKERCKDFGMEFSLGARGDDVKLERRGMNLGARVVGRPHVDLYPVCRRIFTLPRYTLEDIYLELFGKEKEDIDVEKIPQWWAGGQQEQLDTLFTYSMSDADSCLRISHEVLPLQYELTQFIRQPIFEVSRMGTGNSVEWLLMKKAFDAKILVPNGPSDDVARDRSMDTYEGGFVVEPDRGIHENILVFDFRSLYPSIIMAHNIDPATLNCDCCKGNAHVAPTGARFCKKSRGLIPEILDDIIKRRMRAKLELKKLREQKRKDGTEEKILDARQQALKILANSVYGYMGFARARWYSRECARAATAWGRDYIQKTIKKAKEEGLNVVYGDTDSLLITLPGPVSENEILKKKNDFLKVINESLPPAMELEFEGFYPRGVFVTKKRYALVDRDRKLTIKGLETKRRDWANIAKKTQEEVLYTILWENDPKKAAEIVKSRIKELREGKVPLKELVIFTQLTKNLGEYQSIGPHVHAARKAQKRGKTVRQGDLIQYIITKKGASISEKAEMVGFVNENDYDAEYYINNQLLPAVMRILEAVGYKEDELKGLGRQMTLGDW